MHDVFFNVKISIWKIGLLDSENVQLHLLQSFQKNWFFLIIDLITYLLFTFQYNDGINLVQQAIDSCSDSHPLLSKLYVAMGTGYSLKAQGTKLQGDRYTLHKKALETFKR